MFIYLKQSFQNEIFHIKWAWAHLQKKRGGVVGGVVHPGLWEKVIFSIKKKGGGGSVLKYEDEKNQLGHFFRGD